MRFCPKQKQIKLSVEPGVVAHSCNLSTEKAEAGGSPKLRGQAGINSKFQVSQVYRETKYKINLKKWEERAGHSGVQLYHQYSGGRAGGRQILSVRPASET